MTGRLLPPSGFLLLLGVVALLWSCQGDVPEAGSETHFLSYCPTSSSCEGQLSCVCDVCSGDCSTSADCSSIYPDAECITTNTRPVETVCNEMARGTCEVPCAQDADCQSLSNEHRCDRGYCRDLAADCMRGAANSSEVAILGDLFFADSGLVRAELEALARSSGSLSNDQSYRDYSSDLITAFGGENDLFSQYESASADGFIRTVIMDAGGPDTLLPCPEPPTADCSALAGAVMGTEQLLARMSQDGVENVVLFFYPDPEDEALRAKMDVLRPLLEATCTSAPLSCQFLDLRATFTGREAEYLQDGGILPTAAGSTATAELIFSSMERRCIAQ